jgi:hypothetical protein
MRIGYPVDNGDKGALSALIDSSDEERKRTLLPSSRPENVWAWPPPMDELQN